MTYIEGEEKNVMTERERKGKKERENNKTEQE